MTLTFGSLFAGIGGFDIAGERAGMRCAWQVEIDEHCRKVLEHHFPDAKRYGDVREVGKHNLESVDVICGGFPCQDLSVAGKRKGFGGVRSSLFYEMARITDELKPMFLVWENVPGLLSSRDGRDFTAVLRTLDELRYFGAWTMLDARFFGVAQRRRRIFGVFARSDVGAGRCAEILSLSARLYRHSAPRGKARASVAAVAETLAASRGCLDRPAGNANELDFCVPVVTSGEKMFDDKGIHREKLSTDVTPTINAFDTPLTFRIFQQNTRDEVRLLGGDGHIAGALQAESGMRKQNYVAFNWQSGGDVRHNVSECHTSALQANQTPAVIGFSADRDGGDSADNIMPTLRHGGYEPSAYNAFRKPAVAWHENKSGELTPSDIAKSLRAGASHSYQGTGVRRLTPTECERLQGFPDGWTAGQADGNRYRQLGNAVAVPVVTWLMKRIAATNGEA